MFGAGGSRIDRKHAASNGNSNICSHLCTNDFTANDIDGSNMVTNESSDSDSNAITFITTKFTAVSPAVMSTGGQSKSNHLVNLVVNQLHNHLVNQHVNLPVNHLFNHRVNRFDILHRSHLVNQPANRRRSHLRHHRVNQRCSQRSNLRVYW